MKAFVRVDQLSQEVKLADVSIPKIQNDEVLIKVEAFGMGIHDRYFIPMDAKFPYVIGSEGSGIIAEIGNEVANFTVGDKVIFSTVLQAQGGSWAEHAVAKVESLIPLPKSLTFAQGAALPIAGKTALACMRSINLNKGDKLFIAGASGAIGTFVIQLAAQQGVHVSASASSKNQAYMQSLGAEKTVDYNDSEWQNKIIEWSNGGVNTALSIQPGTDSIKVVKDGGKLITVSGDNASVAPERDIKIQQMEHSGDSKEEFIAFINAISNGEIKMEIEKEYAFEKALEALEKTETRHARGKLVVNFSL